MGSLYEKKVRTQTLREDQVKTKGEDWHQGNMAQKEPTQQTPWSWTSKPPEMRESQLLLFKPLVCVIATVANEMTMDFSDIVSYHNQILLFYCFFIPFAAKTCSPAWLLQSEALQNLLFEAEHTKLKQLWKWDESWLWIFSYHCKWLQGLG